MPILIAMPRMQQVNHSDRLLYELHLARMRYHSGECGPDEYTKALKSFGDCMILRKVAQECKREP
jgi:hypothetical protein